MPRVIAGDFNQRIPPLRVPKDVDAELAMTMRNFTIVTQGTLPGLARPGVDHVALSPDLRVRDVGGRSRHIEGVGRVSDHDLVWVDVE